MRSAMTPPELKTHLNRIRNSGAPADPEIVTAGLVGALRGHLMGICQGDGRRRKFLQFIFETDTTNNLDARLWLNVRDWINAQPIEVDGRTRWLADPVCMTEVDPVIVAADELARQAAIGAGQLSFF